MDLQILSDAFSTDDQTWIAPGLLGVDQAVSITLDVSKFDADDHYPNGFLPSGLCIAKVTATGKYGIYDNALSTGQEVAVGFLLEPKRVRTGVTAIGAALLWFGHVIEANLPANHGLDANGKTDLASKFRFA